MKVNSQKAKAKRILARQATGEIPVFTCAALARARKAKPTAKLKKASDILHKVAIVA